jgi:hypothetical protein
MIFSFSQEMFTCFWMWIFFVDGNYCIFKVFSNLFFFFVTKSLKLSLDHQQYHFLTFICREMFCLKFNEFGQSNNMQLKMPVNIIRVCSERITASSCVRICSKEWMPYLIQLEFVVCELKDIEMINKCSFTEDQIWSYYSNCVEIIDLRASK